MQPTPTQFGGFVWTLGIPRDRWLGAWVHATDTYPGWGMVLGRAVFHHVLHIIPKLCYNRRMSISVDEVRHVARLARLELDETEILSFQSELNALIGHFGDIQAMDVTGIEPQSHALAIQNVWAFDAPWQPISRERAIKNAPVSRAGLFVVPMIIEE